MCFRVELPRKPPQSTGAEGDDPTASLNAWERWLVCKAKDERIRMERKAEEVHSRLDFTRLFGGLKDWSSC